MSICLQYRPKPLCCQVESQKNRATGPQRPDAPIHEKTGAIRLAGRATAQWWGGAVAICEAGSPTFVNCTFDGNGNPEWAAPYPGCVSDPEVNCPQTIAGGAVFVYEGLPTATYRERV